MLVILSSTVIDPEQSSAMMESRSDQVSSSGTSSHILCECITVCMYVYLCMPFMYVVQLPC